jgi:soluble lytic murein transglycosylase
MALLTPPGGGLPEVPAAVEALELARRVATEAASDRSASARAKELEARALRALPERERKELEKPSVEEELARVTALVEAREFEEAATLAGTLATRLPKLDRSSESACELALQRAKAWAGNRKWGAAVDALSPFLDSCKAHTEWHARSLFVLGKYATYDKRYAQAIRYFESLELEHKESSLADDARLLGALAYSELGVEARFTELLSTIGDTYPAGDMAVEGLFRLAVKRMDKGDWSSVASILARAVKHLGDKDAERGNEVAGRERYFVARSELELGRREAALAGFEDVVVRFPFSYYMLNAHARLAALDPARAKKARERALAEATREGRPLAPKELSEDPRFARGLELLRVGDTRAAVAELELIGLGKASAGAEVLWTVASLYSQAGATKLGHDLARYRLSDWLTRWPAGDWLEPWRIAFPRAFGEIVEREAKLENLPPSIVFAIMREESAFDPAAESPADAHGLMQLIVPTAKSAAKGTNLPHDRRSLKRPSVNIKLGVRTLARFMRRFPSNPLLGIPGYNAGPLRAKQWFEARPHADFDLWVELIPYLETRRYTKRVLASRATYAFLYEEGSGETALSLPIKVDVAALAAGAVPVPAAAAPKP